MSQPGTAASTSRWIAWRRSEASLCCCRARGETESEALGGVQGVLVPGRQLEDGPPGGREGRASRRGVVPTGGVHCDQPDAAQPAVVRFYNKRGTSEQWIKEGKQAVKMTRLSCHRFRSNEVRLWLSVIAYNLGNLWRRLVLPKRIDKWSLTSLQQRLVKTGGRLVKQCPILMAPVSGESSDAPPLRVDGTADRGAARSHWVT
jgi:Transposase DDE domain group 1